MNTREAADCEHLSIASQTNWTDDDEGGTKPDGRAIFCRDCGTNFEARAAALDVERLAAAWKAYKAALSPRSGVDVMDRLRLLDEFDALMLETAARLSERTDRSSVPIDSRPFTKG